MRKGDGMATLSTWMRSAAIGVTVSLVIASGCTLERAAVRPTATADASVVRPTLTADVTATPSRAAPRNEATYADGVYTATGQYWGLPSSFTVIVTLANSVITAVEVMPHATDLTSLDFQRRFAAAVPAVVVGKRIDEVQVDRLAGSSGTPDCFNAALRRIQQQARRDSTTSD
jgi:uncharacterized protein with FMN-binding domain